MVRRVVLSGHVTESRNYLLRVRRESTFSLPRSGVSLSWGLASLPRGRASSLASSYVRYVGHGGGRVIDYG